MKIIYESKSGQTKGINDDIQQIIIEHGDKVYNIKPVSGELQFVSKTERYLTIKTLSGNAITIK